MLPENWDPLIPSRAPLFKYCPVRPERQRLPRIGGTSGLESASACCPGIIMSRANCEAMGVISKQNKTHVSFSEQQNHPFILREHTPSFVYLFSNVFFYSPKFIKSLQDVSVDWKHFNWDVFLKPTIYSNTNKITMTSNIKRPPEKATHFMWTWKELEKGGKAPKLSFPVTKDLWLNRVWKDHESPDFAFFRSNARTAHHLSSASRPLPRPGTSFKPLYRWQSPFLQDGRQTNFLPTCAHVHLAKLSGQKILRVLRSSRRRWRASLTLDPEADS